MHSHELSTEGESRPDTLRFFVRPQARWVSRVLIGTFAGAAVLVDVTLIVSPQIDLAVRIVFFVVWSLVGGVFLVWLYRRLLRASVVADPAGLHIFNGVRTYVVPWSEVEGFVPSSKPFLMAVKRTHGGPITMAGLTPETFGKRGSQWHDMERLEVYWRQVRELAPS